MDPNITDDLFKAILVLTMCVSAFALIAGVLIGWLLL